MSLRKDLEAVLMNLHSTLKKLSDDINDFQSVLDEHISGNNPNKLGLKPTPRRLMETIEQEVERVTIQREAGNTGAPISNNEIHGRS